MEEESRKDWQRIGLMLVIIASIVFFSVFAFKGGEVSSGSSITGAVIGGGDALTQMWIFPFFAAIIFAAATFAFTRINQ